MVYGDYTIKQDVVCCCMVYGNYIVLTKRCILTFTAVMMAHIPVGKKQKRAKTAGTVQSRATGVVSIAGWYLPGVCQSTV